jgi:hypothetical protein
VLLLLCIAAAPAVKWSRVGDLRQVSIGSDSQIKLNTGKGSVAGALSDRFVLTGDMLIVHADVAKAPARGLTLAVQDASSGDSIGYWQNPIAIDAAQPMDVAIPVANQAKAGRLFVGSDGVESAASISNVSWKSSTKCSAAHGSAYGSLVDSQHVAGQTFLATRTKLDAVLCRLRQLNDVEGPALRVRLYLWKDGAAKREQILAEKIIARQLIPQPKQHDEIELCAALSAKLERGSSYFIEFSCTETCSAEQAYLLFAGDDSYKSGSRYENDSAANNWDLYFETFESD